MSLKLNVKYFVTPEWTPIISFTIIFKTIYFVCGFAAYLIQPVAEFTQPRAYTYF